MEPSFPFEDIPPCISALYNRTSIILATCIQSYDARPCKTPHSERYSTSCQGSYRNHFRWSQSCASGVCIYACDGTHPEFDLLDLCAELEKVSAVG